MKTILLVMLFTLAACEEKIADQLKGCNSTGSCVQAPTGTIQAENSEGEDTEVGQVNIIADLNATLLDDSFTVISISEPALEAELPNGEICRLDFHPGETYTYVIDGESLTITQNGDSRIFQKRGSSWRWTGGNERMLQELDLAFKDENDPFRDDVVQLFFHCEERAPEATPGLVALPIFA